MVKNVRRKAHNKKTAPTKVDTVLYNIDIVKVFYLSLMPRIAANFSSS